ncbi:2-polyprenyl-6-methoxyphenol hydroxylase [Pseudonocardia thermophila]|uniref:2-polyprenyl-6-methoxyphenol hydroxylase n=1 Tax=Pseudonocardia thermophila TaxID=1848 RepID=A0A1M6QKP9_PSETH|nr:FAD-dependent monooxygenase [Pseudonocardia thermophila]SHK20796.1 2-polyprenyl-6-methoxyphenol hydroxylase [Pseudonocardia thermophila]
MPAARTALVIGGGVAGPVAAMALQKAGVAVSVHEARTDPDEDVGSFLTLQVNGISALRAIDAGHVLADVGFPTSAMTFRSGTGKVLGEVSTGEPLPDGTVGITLKRADLHRVLREEARRRGIAFSNGKRLVDVSEAPEGITAVFADGTTATADVLVGADGIHSRVRTIIDPGAPRARYVPVLNIGGYARVPDVELPEGRYEMVFGKRAFFGQAVAPDGTVWWFANPPRRDEPAPGELSAMTTEQWRDWLLTLFADDDTPAARIIAATPGELRGWAIYDLPTLPNWYRDRLVLVGDAAHATSPSSGQGASMAIEDAVELGRCLRDHADPQAAFAAFVGLRRERVEKVVAAGARTSNYKAAGPIARRIRDLLMPIFLKRAAGTGAQSFAWLHRHRIDWDAPVTAEVTA